MNEIGLKQLASADQEKYLQALAEAVGKSGVMMLEVGSWHGDSAIIFGKVAKRYGGHLFCVDWWKGSVGTALEEASQREDPFSIFWERICQEGLGDTVIPIRTRSDIAAGILKENIFDLIFIDGDHRYEPTKQDIQNYAPLVNRHHGILCGHDCEGYISDFEMHFLEEGKNVDCFETIHCGVVLAVGNIFKRYSVNQSVWSVRREGGGWAPTNLVSSEWDGRLRRAMPPPLGMTKSYVLYRHDKYIYAVPHSQSVIDVIVNAVALPDGIIMGNNLSDVERLTGEQAVVNSVPALLGSYEGYNLIQYNRKIYPINKVLGNLDLFHLVETILSIGQNTADCFAGATVSEVKEWIDRYGRGLAVLIESGYNGFNILYFRRMYYAVSQSISDLNLTGTEESILNKYRLSNELFTGDTLQEVKKWIDHFGRGVVELVEADCNGFNILRFRNKYYVVSQSLGDFDLIKAEESYLPGLVKSREVFVFKTLSEAKESANKFERKLERLIRRIRRIMDR